MINVETPDERFLQVILNSCAFLNLDKWLKSWVTTFPFLLLRLWYKKSKRLFISNQLLLSNQNYFNNHQTTHNLSHILVSVSTIQLFPRERWVKNVRRSSSMQGSRIPNTGNPFSCSARLVIRQVTLICLFWRICFPLIASCSWAGWCKFHFAHNHIPIATNCVRHI